MSKRIIGTTLAGVLIIGGVIGTASCLERVKPGYAGVVYSMNGGVTGEVLGQGLHLMSPIEKIAPYPVSVETYNLSRDAKEGSKDDDSFDVSTKDGKPVNVDIELSYRYDADKVDEVYTKWRGKSPKEIEDTYLKARVKSVANEVTSQYPVMDVYGEKRTELNQKVFEKLRSTLGEEGLIVETFNFTRIEPDLQTLQAIQSKVDAQQKLEQDKIEAQRQDIENQKQIDKAKADQEKQNIEATERAKRIEINAKADSDAIKINAEAQAKANKLINESLTDKLLELKKYEKWDGKQPQIQGNVTPIVDLNK